MTVKNFNADKSKTESFDIIAMLAERMTQAEREAVAQENANYLQARDRRLALCAANGNSRARGRQQPENFRRLQAAIRSLDAMATEAAWDSCEHWLMADLPADLAPRAANELGQPAKCEKPVQNVCVPRGAWLH